MKPVVSDFGRSRGNPNARSQKTCERTAPLAGPAPPHGEAAEVLAGLLAVLRGDLDDPELGAEGGDRRRGVLRVRAGLQQRLPDLPDKGSWLKRTLQTGDKSGASLDRTKLSLSKNCDT